jgi:hypothetical protein
MKIIHDLAAPGGVIVHTVPTQGYLMHGMITYTPKFFRSLAQSCRYRISEMHVCSSEGNAAVSVVEPEVVLESFRTRDACLQVVMQKSEDDIAFVPPIELHAGVVDDPAIRSRYWTVLD